MIRIYSQGTSQLLSNLPLLAGGEGRGTRDNNQDSLFFSCFHPRMVSMMREDEWCRWVTDDDRVPAVGKHGFPL